MNRNEFAHTLIRGLHERIRNQFIEDLDFLSKEPECSDGEWEDVWMGHITRLEKLEKLEVSPDLRFSEILELLEDWYDPENHDDYETAFFDVIESLEDGHLFEEEE